MRIHVVAAVLQDHQGRVLLSKRHDDAHQGGLWEFPGGKLEPDESPEDGLRRELREELGIVSETHRPLIRLAHDYEDKQVLLDVYRVQNYEGVPEGLEQQPLAWVAPEDLPDYEMPAADRPIVAAIRLPDSYAITPPAVDDPAAFLADLKRLLEQGCKLVQLRLFGLSPGAYRALAAGVVESCQAHQARVIINSDAALARQLGADGVHLSTRQLDQLQERPSGLNWVSASCHNAQDLQRAVELGLDFAVLSPVLPTPSHPDAEPLGWTRFAELVDGLPLPVYALGGMQSELLAKAWDAGAQGVAGIRGFWPGQVD